MAASGTKRVRIERRAPAPRRAHGGMLAAVLVESARGPDGRAVSRAPAGVVHLRRCADTTRVRGATHRHGDARRPRLPLVLVGGRTRPVRDHARHPAPDRARASEARGVRTSPPRIVEALARARCTFARHDLSRCVRLRARALRLRQLGPLRGAGSRSQRLGLEPRSGIHRILRRCDARCARGRGAHVSRARGSRSSCRGAPCSRSA